MRGIDNAAYYRLEDKDKRYYTDYTGTGNSLNVGNPHALQLIMDSLRYWVLEMHVDGFRFDLAATLAREFYDVDRLATFFELVQQDPVVSQVKLIAEPWDIGPGGYQVGNFPPQWTEWNGKYRDTVRDFWRGEPSTLGEFASRLTGSADLYEHSGRRPVASINFVTAHDGFTLRDLVSYNEKHNEANGENNNDGESHNRSMNFGVEGPTDDPAILTMRARQQRNFIATLMLSQGVPMLLHGDELGRTQLGQQQRLRAGQRADVGALGRRRPAAARVHRRTRAPPAGAPDVPAQPVLQRPPGAPRSRAPRFPTSPGCAPTAARCSPRTGRPASAARSACSSTAHGIRERDRRGEPIADKHFIVLFNAGDDDVDFHIPAVEYSPRWDILVDTAGRARRHRSDRTGNVHRRARQGDARPGRAHRARRRGRPLRGGIARRDRRQPEPR